ncbi:hypothetical protein Droror1_Dr00016019 [Drosera rotundifolia]
MPPPPPPHWPPPHPPPHPLPSATGNPQLQQYLHHLLLSSHHFPYPDSSKPIIFHHILSLSSILPSLTPTPSPTTFSGDPTSSLLSISGTIPVPYYGVTYNIPILIYLTEAYPMDPPRVCLNPTRDMVIKGSHPNVDDSGIVWVPCLQNWVFPGSDLVGLVRELIRVFEVDMPVYSRPRRDRDRDRERDSVVGEGSIGSGIVGSVDSGFGAHRGTDSREYGAYSYGDSYGGNPVMVSSNSSVHSGFGARPSIPYGDYGSSPCVSAGRFREPRARMDDSDEVVKRKMMDRLVEMVQGDVVAMKKGREGEMEGFLRVQAAMRRRGSEIERGLREMRHKMEGLEQELQVVLRNADVLGDWLKENEGKMGGFGKVNVDEIFEFDDGLGRQMVECMAADMAIEDVIYSLDRAVQDGVVSFDVYLRNVRLLSREQFIHRATAGKVKAVQAQAQVAPMASRISQFRI